MSRSIRPTSPNRSRIALASFSARIRRFCKTMGCHQASSSRPVRRFSSLAIVISASCPLIGSVSQITTIKLYVPHVAPRSSVLHLPGFVQACPAQIRLQTTSWYLGASYRICCPWIVNRHHSDGSVVEVWEEEQVVKFHITWQTGVHPKNDKFDTAQGRWIQEGCGHCFVTFETYARLKNGFRNAVKAEAVANLRRIDLVTYIVEQDTLNRRWQVRPQSGLSGRRVRLPAIGCKLGYRRSLKA